MRKQLSIAMLVVCMVFTTGPVPAALAQSDCDGAEGVYLYEHDDYQGRCLRFTEDTPNLGWYTFDDTASSLRVIGNWTLTLYSDPEYSGDTSTFTADDIDLRGDTVGTDRASSLRVRRGSIEPVPSFNICDGGNGVYLYEHPNYQGRCIKATQDILDLRRLAFDDQASSIRFVGSWTATLYSDLNGTGAATSFIQNTPSFAADSIGDNQASSIRVQRADTPANEVCDGREGVYLYEHERYLGRCIRFTSDAPDLRAYGFDDIASSVRIVGNWTAVLASDLGGAGVRSSFTQDNPALFDDPVGDNQATSLQVLRGSPPPSGNNCDGGEGLYLYEHPNYQGRCLKITGAAVDLRVYDFDDIASSVQIVGSWTAILYRDLSGTGIASAFTRDDPNLADDSVGDNQVTSVVVRR